MGSPAAANRRSRAKQNEKNIYRRGSTEKKRTDETSRHWDSACKKGPGAQNFLSGRRYTSWKWLQASCKFTILNRPRNDAIRAKRLGELGSTCALPKLAACLLYTTNFTTKGIFVDNVRKRVKRNKRASPRMRPQFRQIEHRRVSGCLGIISADYLFPYPTFLFSADYLPVW